MAALALLLAGCAPQPIHYVRSVHIEPPPPRDRGGPSALVVKECDAHVYRTTGFHDDACYTSVELLP